MHELVAGAVSLLSTISGTLRFVLLQLLFFILVLLFILFHYLLVFFSVSFVPLFLSIASYGSINLLIDFIIFLKIVLLACKSSITILEQVSLQKLFPVHLTDLNEYPHSDVELIALDEQWILDVLLDYKGVGLDIFTIHPDADLERSFAEQFRELFQ